jgi:hypothetical protein
MLPAPSLTAVRLLPRLAVLCACASVVPAATAGAPPAGTVLPPLELAYVCDAPLAVTTVRALRGDAVLAELTVQGCEPAGRAFDGSPLVTATVFARLRDRLLASGHEREARLVARPLGSFAALPQEMLPPGLLAAPKEGITVEWCGTVVSKDRDDCLGTCSCGNKDGCPCHATKTTSPKSDVESQTN